jgi:hypothetical protein
MQGVALDIEYLSAAAAAQRSVEGNAALRVIQDIAPLVQIKPRLADRIGRDDRTMKATTTTTNQAWIQA